VDGPIAGGGGREVVGGPTPGGGTRSRPQLGEGFFPRVPVFIILNALGIKANEKWGPLRKEHEDGNGQYYNLLMRN